MTILQGQDDGSITLPTALRRRLEQPRFDAALWSKLTCGLWLAELWRSAGLWFDRLMRWCACWAALAADT